VPLPARPAFTAVALCSFVSPFLSSPSENLSFLPNSPLKAPINVRHTCGRGHCHKLTEQNHRTANQACFREYRTTKDPPRDPRTTVTQAGGRRKPFLDPVSPIPNEPGGACRNVSRWMGASPRGARGKTDPPFPRLDHDHSSHQRIRIHITSHQ